MIRLRRNRLEGSEYERQMIANFSGGRVGWLTPHYAVLAWGVSDKHSLSLVNRL